MRSTEASVYIAPDEAGRYLPEGPRDVSALTPGEHTLAWVNIQRGSGSTVGTVQFHSFEPRSEPEVGIVDCPGRPGFLLPARARGDKNAGNGQYGHLLFWIDKYLYLFKTPERTWTNVVTIPDSNPRTIINDGQVVPGGKAVVFGTKDTQFREPIANLYLYTVDDNRMSVLADKQTCSNGKVFRTDDRGLVLYDIDTPTHKVVRYRLDVATRTATPDGVAVDLAGREGSPDGMCDCGDGTVIIAFYNKHFAPAGKAIRFDLATGAAIEEWTTPGSPRVTCPLLVKRPNGVKLILTTATEGMPADMQAMCPNAGYLFIADTQLATCPEPEPVRLP